MTLSIITINYNNRDGLQKTITSVVSQTVKEFEWVVIDGGSDSNSIFVMHGGEASFTNIKFTNANPSYGGAIFMNSGSGTGKTVYE